MKKYGTMMLRASMIDIYAGLAFPFDSCNNEWLFLLQCNMPTVSVSTDTEYGCGFNLDRCLQDGVIITRRPTVGGPMYYDNRCFSGYLKRRTPDTVYTMDLFIRALAELGIHGEIANNDILIGGQKFMGFAATTSGDCDHSISFAGNIGVESFTFVKYLNPSSDKLERHGSNYMESRITKLNNFASNLSVEDFLNKVYELYGADNAITFDDMMKNEDYCARHAIYSSAAWIKFKSRTGEAYKVQKIIFKNKKTVTVDRVLGNTVDGQERLTFVLPAQPGIEFNDLLELASEPKNTKTITIVSEDQTGESLPRRNAQVGFTDFKALNYDPGTNMFTLELGKQ